MWLGAGGAYVWDKNTSARLSAKNAGGAYARGEANLRDTTVHIYIHTYIHTWYMHIYMNNTYTTYIHTTYIYTCIYIRTYIHTNPNYMHCSYQPCDKALGRTSSFYTSWSLNWSTGCLGASQVGIPIFHCTGCAVVHTKWCNHTRFSTSIPWLCTLESCDKDTTSSSSCWRVSTPHSVKQSAYACWQNNCTSPSCDTWMTSTSCFCL